MTETKTIFVPLTKKCNYHCRYCLAVPRASWALPDKEYLDNLNFEKYDKINLTGGEPSLAKKALYYSLKLIGKEKKVLIQTNGSHFNLIDMLRLRKYNVHFSVSLPAANPYTFYYLTGNREFKRALRKIRLINKFFTDKMSIKWVLTRQTVADQKEYIALLKKLKIKEVSLGMVLNNREPGYEKYMPNLLYVKEVLQNLTNAGIVARPLQFPKCVVGNFKQSTQSAKKTDLITYELQTTMNSPYFKIAEIPADYHGSMHTEKCLKCIHYERKDCMGFPADYIRVYGTTHQKPVVEKVLEDHYKDIEKRLEDLVAPYDLCGLKSSQICKGNLALASNPAFDSSSKVARCCRDVRYENVSSPKVCDYLDKDKCKCKIDSLGCKFWYCPEVVLPPEIAEQFFKLKDEARNAGFLKIRKDFKEILEDML